MTMLKLLRLYLRLGVEGEADPPEQAADEGTGDDTLDDLIDEIEPGAEPQQADQKDSAIVKEARRRADAAERALADERAARQRETPPQRQIADPTYEQEEAQLAEARRGDDKAYARLLEWQINSSRTIRNTERNSTAALAEARDIADKTAFDRLEITKPQVYKRYAAEVDKRVAQARANGQNLPRLEMLKWLIGEDVMNGKVKPKAAAKLAPEGASTRQVDRGRMPGTRSDTTGKAGAVTERDKRRARLENQII